MNPSKVICYLLDVMPLDKEFDLWLSLLPEERKERCLRYVQKKDRLLSLGAGLLVEAFVGKGPYTFNRYGKPYKEGRPFFSLSHSGDYVLLAVASDEVGADIERIGEKDPKLIAYCFDENERTSILNQEDFFLAWSEKEALGKLLGFGMKDPKKTPVRHLDGGEIVFEGERCFTLKWLREGYTLAVALKEEFEIDLKLVQAETLKENIQ